MSRNSFFSLLRLLALWVGCFLWRLVPVPIRPPNIEPVFATLMPVSKYYGPFVAFLFGSLSIVVYDFTLGMVGGWTWTAAIAYGLVGLGSWAYFKNRKGVIHYVIYAVIGTLIYDAITGVIVGPIFLGQTFREAFVGQIPFTINHLIGNVLLSLVLSPLVDYLLAKYQPSKALLERA